MTFCKYELTICQNIHIYMISSDLVGSNVRYIDFNRRNKLALFFASKFRCRASDFNNSRTEVRELKIGLRSLWIVCCYCSRFSLQQWRHVQLVYNYRVRALKPKTHQGAALRCAARGRTAIAHYAYYLECTQGCAILRCAVWLITFRAIFWTHALGGEACINILSNGERL